MSKWKEVVSDYTDDEGVTSIDAYRTDKDDESGKVIARVRPSGTVDYVDYDAMSDEYAQSVIKETAKRNREEFEKKNSKNSVELLQDAWDKVQKEKDCSKHINELLVQIKIIGTEYNSLTKQTLYNKLKVVIGDIEKSLEP